MLMKYLLLILLLWICSPISVKNSTIIEAYPEYYMAYYLTDNYDLICPKHNPDASSVCYDNWFKKILLSDVKPGTVTNHMAITNQNELYFHQYKFTYWWDIEKSDEPILIAEDVVSADEIAAGASEIKLYTGTDVGEDILIRYISYLTESNELCILGYNPFDEQYYAVGDPFILTDSAVQYEASGEMIIWEDPNGTLWGAGRNYNNLLGDSLPEDDFTTQPVQLPLEDIQDFELYGYYGICAILYRTNENELYLVGRFMNEFYSPDNPLYISDQVVNYSIEEDMIVAVTENGDAYYYGQNAISKGTKWGELIGSDIANAHTIDTTIMLTTNDGKTLTYSFSSLGDIYFDQYGDSNLDGVAYLGDEPITWK